MSQSLSIAKTRKKSAKSKEIDQIFLWCPDNFDPKAFLPAKLHRYADCARYFLHRIHYGQVFGRLGDAGYVRLKAHYLHRFINRRKYNDIRKALIDSGSIECEVAGGKETYSVGDQAKGYRIGPALLDSEWIRYETRYAPLRRAIKKWRLEDPTNRRLTPNYDFVLSNLNSLEIDRERAEKIIASIEGDDTYKKRLGTIVDAIVQGDFHGKPCPYGRLHHNITNLKSDLRRCLHVNGQPLVNVDIRNSQPLFLCLLIRICERNRGYLEHLSSFCPKPADKGMDWDFFSNDEIIELFEKSVSKEEEKEEKEEKGIENSLPHYVATFDLNPYFTRDLDAIQAVNEDDQDSPTFLRLCETGQLYDSFTDDETTRDQAKKRLFSEVLYAKNHVLKGSEFGRRFEERFPYVFRFIRRIKKRDFGNLSRLMQRYEAAFMFDRVVDRIRRERMETLVVTIHDSILTTPERVDYVISVLREEFEALGLSPTLKVESYAA